MTVLFCISQKHCDSGNSLKLPCRTCTVAKLIAKITLYLTVYLILNMLVETREQTFLSNYDVLLVTLKVIPVIYCHVSEWRSAIISEGCDTM